MAETTRWTTLVVTVSILILGVSAASGQGIDDLQIDGQEVTGTISLAGGIEASLLIVFENASGLTLSNLGLSAELVSATDPGLLARMPIGAVTTLPGTFPVLLRWAPPAGSTLSFDGVVTVEIYTHDLSYTVGTSLRLFAAEPGGSFEDVSAWMDSGSYRVGAVHPEFAREQVIVLDTRPVQAVVGQQLGSLESTLASHVGVIDADVFATLDGLVQQARTQIDVDDDPASARTTMTGLAQALVEHAGASIPNTWQADDSLDNVAGELRAEVARLDFSLLRQHSAGLQP